MNAFEIAGGIILLVCSVIIVITVMMQEGKSGGLNALSGSNESSYLGTHKNRSNKAMLLRLTKFTAIVFVIATLAVYLVNAALQSGAPTV